jgi:hypothetical protein
VLGASPIWLSNPIAQTTGGIPDIPGDVEVDIVTRKIKIPLILILERVGSGVAWILNTYNLTPDQNRNIAGELSVS